MKDHEFKSARPVPDSGFGYKDMPGQGRTHELEQKYLGADGFDLPTSHTGTRSPVFDPEWLSVTDAVAYCANKGLSRNIKTVRRWAHRSVAHPETAEVLAQKQDTETDFRYVIERGSLDVKIAQELAFEAQQSKPDTGGHNLTGPDTPDGEASRYGNDLHQRAEPHVSTDDRAGVDRARDHNGLGNEASVKQPEAHSDVAFLKEQAAEKDRQIGKLNQQLERRDEQIMAMLERDRETNILIKGLQEALLPVSSSPALDRKLSTKDAQARIDSTDVRTRENAENIARRLEVRPGYEGDSAVDENASDGVY